MTLRSDATTREFIIWLLLYATRIGILLVLFMPLVVTSSTLFPFIVGKAIFARSTIEVTFASWLVLLFLAPEFRPKRSWILIAFGVWLAASVIAGYSGVSLQRSLWSTYERMQGIIDLAHWIGFILVAGTVFRTLNDWKWLLSINLGVSMFASLLGLGQNFEIFNSSILGAPGRISSTLGNATYVGAYTMVNTFTALGMIAHFWARSEPEEKVEIAPTSASRASRRRRRRGARARSQATEFDWLPYLRVFWGVAVFVNLWALWQSGTRGALLGLGSGIVLFALIYAVWVNVDIIRKISYAIMGLVIIFLVLFIVARTTSVLDPVIDTSSTLKRISTIDTNDLSIKGRITSISAGFQGYLEKPIFGWGPENYLIAWGRYFDADSGVQERFDQAHNKLVEELTTKGTVGIVTYLAIWVAMIWVFVRAVNRRTGTEQAFVVLVGAALAAFFVQNLFLFDSPVTVLQFALLASFFISEEMNQRQSDIEASEPEGPEFGIGARLSILLQNPGAATVGAVVVAVVLSLSLYFLNIKPYNAASTIVLTSDPSITWERRFELFEQSIDQFPALANYPRLLLVSQVSENLQSLTVEEFETAMSLAENEATQGLIDEPENWRIHVSMARWYQTAAQVDIALLERSRVHIDEADRLAPRTLEVSVLKTEQERLEAIVAEQQNQIP